MVASEINDRKPLLMTQSPSLSLPDCHVDPEDVWMVDEEMMKKRTVKGMMT